MKLTSVREETETVIGEQFDKLFEAYGKKL